MSALTIRLLHPSDFANGFLEALEALTSVGLDADSAIEVYQDLPDNLKTFVAIRGDRVVGTCSLLIERKFIHGGGKVGHIEDVAVSKSAQRQGVGTALIRHSIADAQNEGCYKVILDCFDDLVPFYGRMGFKPFNRGLRIDLPVKQSMEHENLIADRPNHAATVTACVAADANPN